MGSCRNYHLCIDSSVLGIDGTVQFIKEFVKLKLGIQKITLKKDLGKYVQTKPTVTALEVMHKANCFRASKPRRKQQNIGDSYHPPQMKNSPDYSRLRSFFSFRYS